MILQYKKINSGLAIKDADLKLGIVTGYLSEMGDSIDKIDADHDVMHEKAYNRTIAECGPKSTKPRIKHLQDHDKFNCVGVFQVLEPKNSKLYYESKIGSHTKGQDHLKMCIDGIITEHSVGFQTVHQEKKEGFNLITEVKLWEGSGLQTWGANANTPIESVKSQEDLLQLFIKLDKALHYGTYSDDTMIELQKQFDSIGLHFKSQSGIITEQDLTRERIELKSVSWEEYQLLPEDKQKALSFIGEVRYGVSSILRGCGEARANTTTEIYSEEIFKLSKPVKDYLEVAENQILTGIEIIKQDDLTTEEKAITDPQASIQPIEETALELFTKSLNTSK